MHFSMAGAVWVAHAYVNISYSVWPIVGTHEVFLERMKGFMVVKRWWNS